MQAARGPTPRGHKWRPTDGKYRDTARTGAVVDGAVVDGAVRDTTYLLRSDASTNGTLDREHHFYSGTMRNSMRF
jgi:hypothetical protein